MMTPRSVVVIPLTAEEHDVLTTRLLDVACDRDPVVGWRELEDDELTDEERDDPWREPVPIRGDRADYVDHPLLSLAQAIVYPDPNLDVFLGALRATGRPFTVQS